MFPSYHLGGRGAGRVDLADDVFVLCLIFGWMALFSEPRCGGTDGRARGNIYGELIAPRFVGIGRAR